VSRLFILLCGLLVGALTAHAQIPFYTDDADTTKKGKFHLEMFNEHDVLQRSSYPTKRQNTLVFTLNYGLTDKLELGVNAPLITLSNARVADQRTISGQGDLQFGLKYRLRDEREGSRLPAFTVAFYVEAPTGSVKKQLGSGLTDFWLYGIAQKSVTKRTKVRANGGVLFSGNSSTGLIGIRTEKGRVYTGNFSVVRSFTEKLKLGGELFGAVTSNFNLDRGQLTTQLGGDYSVNDKFTFTFGILGGRFSASPRAGFHLGFAYDF
jgi:hypothetical protein